MNDSLLPVLVVAYCMAALAVSVSFVLLFLSFDGVLPSFVDCSLVVVLSLGAFFLGALIAHYRAHFVRAE